MVTSLVIFMRLVEILLILVLVILSFQLFFPSVIKNIKKRTLIGWLSIAGVAITLCHFALEGYRWQMIPVYILSIVFFAHGLLHYVKELRIQTGLAPPDETRPRLRRAIAILVISMLVVTPTLFLDNILPVFTLPDPTGSYNVGTVTFDLTDTNRNETFTENPDDHRRILIQAWYPADDVSGYSAAPYVYDQQSFGIGIQQSFGFPSLIVSHVSLVTTHSYEGAPVSQDETSFPVLLFSHGYGGFVMQNTVLMEEMASHGYIVFSIAHPYEAAVTIFPDGTAIYEATQETLEQITNSLVIWAEDTMFLLDQLEISDNDNIPSIFNGKLDFSRIGAMGHSFGGTTAEEVVLIDPRVQAGISFDTPHIGHSLDMNLTKPFMLLFGQDYGNPEMNDTVYLRSQSTCYGIFVNGTRHYNFADVQIWSSLLKLFGWLGPIDGYRMLEIQNRYVLAFFDEALKGTDSSFLDGPPTEYPEVQFYYNGL